MIQYPSKERIGVGQAVTVTGLLIAFSSIAVATPWYTQDPRTLKEGKWRLEGHVLYTSIDSALSDGDEVPLASATKASSLVSLVRARYGVRDDLTLFVDIPWVNKRAHLRDGTVLDEEGLGDLAFVAKWKYHDNPDQKTRRAWAAGVKTRTGDYRGRPALVATGSGTTNWNLTHLWEQQVGSTTWFGNLTYSLTGRNHDTGVDPGDVFLFNLAAEHPVAPGWTVVGELNGRYQGHFDKPGNPHVLGSSTVVSLTSGVQHTWKRPGGQTTVEAGVQFPVITRGDQPSIPDHEIHVGVFTVF